MSLQDDIFDLEALLKGKPGAEEFQNLKQTLYAAWEENDELRTENVHLKAAFLDATLKRYRT